MTLYAWGANSYGQLGLGHKSDEEISPKEVQLKGSDLKAHEIISIAAGAGHTLILDVHGFVYCCGWNSKGQLGLSDDTLKLTQIEILKEFKIVQISCGWDFSAAVSECGKQFVWGNNQHTQLGLSKSITCTGIPSRLQVSQKLATGFKQVSCGLRHSAMITKDGGLLVAGTGAKGQLGLGDDFDDNNYLSISRVPELNDVISSASGQHHTLALRENGTVLSWGENKFGQLGVDPNVANSFIPLEVFHHDGLESVYAGWTHSAALTKNGEVFTWGRNSYGQLGSERDVPFKPEKIPTLSSIGQLSVGSEHNLAVTRDKKLYAWGWNEHGSCGTGDKKDVRVPTQIFNSKKVKYAYACTGSSFAVVEYEEEARFLQDRIHLAEKNLAGLCDVFGQYARKAARIRDKGDEVAKTVLNFSVGENINKSLAIGLENFADSMSTLSDYGDARTQTLESKVVGEFSRYEDVCKRAKEEVKDIFAAREREVQRKRQLDRIRDRNPRNRQQIVQAETDLVKATAELSKTVHSIEEKATTFERQKLHDTKSILLDFISIELGYHAKALEVLTKAFSFVDSINEESDLEEFKKSLRLPGTIRRHSPDRRNSLFRSAQSLGSLGALFSTSNSKKNLRTRHSREKVNKSEETLDSIKHSMSESEDNPSESEESVESSEDQSEKEESPVAVRRASRKSQ